LPDLYFEANLGLESFFSINKHVVFQFWHNFVFKNTRLLHKNDHVTEMELQDGKIQDQD